MKVDGGESEESTCTDDTDSHDESDVAIDEVDSYR